jgi:hypothetical protein
VIEVIVIGTNDVPSMIFNESSQIFDREFATGNDIISGKMQEMEPIIEWRKI